MRLKKIGTLAVIAMVLVSGAVAAAGWDTETTNTTTTSDVDASTTSVAFDPGNENKALYVEVTAATSNLTLKLSPAAEGVDWVAYSNSTPDTTDATNGHYAWNVTHKELSDLPRDVDGGAYNVTVVNKSGAELLNKEVTFDSSAENDSAVLAVTSDAGEDGAAMTSLVADTMELSSADVGFLGLSSKYLGADKTNISTWTGYTNVNGTATDVEVDLENSTTADAYASAAKGAEDGETLSGMTMWVNGVPHRVYMNSAPDDLANDTTTVVYDNSTESLTIDTKGTLYENSRVLQIRSTGGSGYSFSSLWSNFGALSAIKSLNPL